MYFLSKQALNLNDLSIQTHDLSLQNNIQSQPELGLFILK